MIYFIVWLKSERCPPIEEVIQSGVVPRFVEFLVEGKTHSGSMDLAI